jgi:hypothetical protein
MMPNITIYLTDDEYAKYRRLSDDSMSNLKDKFRQSLEKIGV